MCCSGNYFGVLFWQLFVPCECPNEAAPILFRPAGSSDPRMVSSEAPPSTRSSRPGLSAIAVCHEYRRFVEVADESAQKFVLIAG